MNGPNPVCTSATQNANQSRARWLRREAAIGGSGGSARGGGGGAASRPPGRLDWRRWPGAGALGRLPLRCCCLARGRGSPGTPRANNHHRLTALVFGRQSHLVTGQVHGDSGGGEVQGAPIDGNLAHADSEEAAEIDDGGAHLSVM